MPRKRGRRGAGTIVKRDGRYQAQWSSTEGGKRIRKSATFILRTDADWWLRQAERNGVTPDVGLTTGEYLDRWLIATRPKIAASTWTSYADHVRLLLKPRLGSIPVTALQPRHVERLIADLLRTSSKRGRPYSPTTVGLIVTTLRTALARGVKQRELPDNAAADVTLPRKTEHSTPALTPVDALAIVDAVRETWLEPIIRLVMGSGLRLGEACGLNQGDLMLDKGYVRLRITKTQTRAVKVSRDGIAALRDAVAMAPRVGPREPVFFGQRTGDRLRGSSVSHALPRELDRAGLSRFTPHGLRHGAASLLLAGGTPMRMIAEQLGHANPSMTAKVYAHVAPESIDTALDLLDEAVRRR